MSEIGFLIIGAQKGGTTSLFEHIRRHPQLHMPAAKDIAFFNRDRNFRRGCDWYLRTVTREAPADAVCGEASTYYMSGTPFGDLIANEQRVPDERPEDGAPLEEVVPRRIKRYLPDVKLICVLRDPVERAFSHYRMMVLERAESRSFDEAVGELLSAEALERARALPTRTNNYIVNGEYFRVLCGFLRTFSRKQLLVIFSDQLEDSPAATMERVFGFIGVAADFVPDNLNTRYRAAADEERIPGLNLYAWQTHLARMRSARGLWYSLPDRVRMRIDRGFTLASYRMQMWNAKRGVAGDDMSRRAREMLIDHFRVDGEALGDVLGVDVPWLGSWGRSGEHRRETYDVKTA
jgi:hypothetical protein